MVAAPSCFGAEQFTSNPLHFLMMIVYMDRSASRL